MWSSYPLTWVLLSLLHWASINLMQNALHTPSLLLLAHFPFRLRLAGACPSDGSHLLPPLLYLQLISHCQHLPRLPSQRRLVFLHSRWAEASLWRAGQSRRWRNRTFCSMLGSQNGDCWTLLHWPVSALPIPIVFDFSGRASRLNIGLLWRVQNQEDLEGCCWPGLWPYPHLDEKRTCPMSLASVSSGSMLPFWLVTAQWHSFSAWNLLFDV